MTNDNYNFKVNKFIFQRRKKTQFTQVFLTYDFSYMNLW